MPLALGNAGIVPVRLQDIMNGGVAILMLCGCLYVPHRVVFVGKLRGAREDEIDVSDGLAKVRVECAVKSADEALQTVRINVCEQDCAEDDIVRVIGTPKTRAGYPGLVVEALNIVRLEEKAELEQVCHFLEAVLVRVKTEQEACVNCAPRKSSVDAGIEMRNCMVSPHAKSEVSSTQFWSPTQKMSEQHEWIGKREVVIG